MEEYNDKLHDIIKSRLAERDRKHQSIRRWSHNKSIVGIRPVIGFAVAACLVGVLFFIPWSKAPEDVGGVRSASGNIDDLIRLEEYEDALILVEKEMVSLDSVLQVLEHDTSAVDEETEYYIRAVKLKISNLKEKKDYISKKIN